jgi:hypothetical protein
LFRQLLFGSPFTSSSPLSPLSSPLPLHALLLLPVVVVVVIVSGYTLFEALFAKRRLQPPQKPHNQRSLFKTVLTTAFTNIRPLPDLPCLPLIDPTRSNSLPRSSRSSTQIAVCTRVHSEIQIMSNQSKHSWFHSKTFKTKSHFLSLSLAKKLQSTNVDISR